MSYSATHESRRRNQKRHEDSQSVTIEGTVKWFHLSRGFGFIVGDNGFGEVLLHIDELKACGYKNANEGARIGVEVESRKKGLRATRILWIDNSTAVESEGHVRIVPTGELHGWEKMTVRWISARRGYGFLTRGENTPDVFFHFELIYKSGITKLAIGQVLEVLYGRTENGLAAANIRRPKK